MGIATHLGPWVLGTVRSSTGTTAGLVRNTGATIVAQTKEIVLADGANTITAMSLPAGALVTSMQFIANVVFATGTITINIGGTAYAAGVALPTTLGITTVSPAATAPAAAAVGSVDELVTYTMAGPPTGAGASVTLVVAYMVRQPDGTYVPTAFTGP